MLAGIKNKIIISILKSLVSKYFNDLKIKGYELKVTANDNSYQINATLPKTSIDGLIGKIK